MSCDQAAVEAQAALARAISKCWQASAPYSGAQDTARAILDAIRAGTVPGVYQTVTYEAQLQVNAELRAEVERLRSELTESPMAALKSAINRLEDSASLRVERDRLMLEVEAAWRASSLSRWVNPSSIPARAGRLGGFPTSRACIRASSDFKRSTSAARCARAARSCCAWASSALTWASSPAWVVAR